MTGLTVDQRFLNHKNGHKSSWVVKRYGDRLLPELYEHLNPMPYEAAMQMEKGNVNNNHDNALRPVVAFCELAGIRW